MANVLAAVYSILNGRATLTDLVGDRIRRARLTQSLALPAVIFQRGTVVHRATHNSADDGLPRARVILTCLAASDTEADTVADEVRTALAGFVGTAGGVAIESCLVVGETDLPQTDLDAYGVQLDAIIAYVQT